LAFLTGGMIWSSYGHLGEGLMRAKTALDIASEIENHHWMAGAYYSLGEAYFALLDYNQALEVLEAGLKVARPQGSAFWTGHFIATLALACGTVGNFQRAELLLEEGLPQGQAPHNVHERRMVWVRAELALMQRKPEEALYLAETLSNSAPGQMRERPIPMLLKVRGQALVMLGRFKEGCRLLEEARRAAHELGACVFLWQIQCVLVHVYLLYKKRVYAHRELGIAYKMLDELANSIDEGEQRERFRSAARSRLPSVRPLTSKQAAKESFDGLSEREREIARLIVLGKTNREIAETLVISQRTVGTHLEHMYAKLNLGTRAQLTTWAISKGLGE
ncbi:MAG TPA: LuxR C-terminal-related transcriptional regulator, partial [Ktedonobacteraceae bacterium]|nr:LuxR C-terminal-related transcriptional regulator [Ktedonobacteraceae bacterium]